MSEDVKVRNTVKIDGKDYVIADLPDVAKVAIEHLMAIDKESQRLEMSRAGFAQAIKSVMESDEAPEPVGGTEETEETAEFVPEEV
jgi:hypothetical protein